MPGRSFPTTATRSPAAFTASASPSSMRCPSILIWRSGGTAASIPSPMSAACRRPPWRWSARPKAGEPQITFKPDDTIFEDTEFSYDTVSNRLRELAFLNSGVKITLIDERIDRQSEYFYKGGIVSFVEYINRNKKVLHKNPIFITGAKEDCLVEVALQYNDTYAENIFSFANSINTTEGGTHLIGFRSALTRAFNNYATSSNILKNGKESLKGEDLREGLACVISVKIRNPQFEGQTKTKLGQQRGQGPRRGDRLRQDQQLSGGKPLRRQAAPGQVPGCGPGARSGPARPRTDPAQDRPRGRRPPRKTGRLPGARSGPERDLPRRGGLGRRLRQTGPGPEEPGHPAAPRQGAQRRKGALRQDAPERGAQGDHHRPRHGDRPRRTRTSASFATTR